MKLGIIMRFGKVSTGIIIVAFMLVGAAGVAYAGPMMGHGMDAMAGCPLMGHSAAVCSMNPLAHLSAWQSLFAAILVQSTVLSLLLLLALFLTLRLSQYLWLLYPSPQPACFTYDPECATYDPLRRFIARGLMHPKVF